MIVTYEGQAYTFDLMKMPTEELREVKRKLGLTVRKFLEGITESDVEAMLALKWAVLRSDGRHDDLLLDPTDPFPDYWQFLEAWNGASEQEEEPDPTQAGSPPATSSPESSGSSAPILTTSPPSTASPSPAGAEYANGRSDGSPSEASSPTFSA